MYDLLEKIINHNYVQNDPMQQYLIYGAILLSVVSLVGFVRIMIDAIRSFWR